MPRGVSLRTGPIVPPNYVLARFGGFALRCRLRSIVRRSEAHLDGWWTTIYASWEVTAGRFVAGPERASSHVCVGPQLYIDTRTIAL